MGNGYKWLKQLKKKFPYGYVKIFLALFFVFCAANLFGLESETEDEVSSVPNCF